jgi:hypothetical protein
MVGEGNFERNFQLGAGLVATRGPRVGFLNFAAVTDPEASTRAACGYVNCPILRQSQLRGLTLPNGFSYNPAKPPGRVLCDTGLQALIFGTYVDSPRQNSLHEHMFHNESKSQV